MQQVLARKDVQKTKLEAAEMILDPWNQRSVFTEAEPTCSKINKILEINVPQ